MPSPEIGLVIEERDQMNLMGLMLGGVIASNLARPQGAALARKLSGALGITAGKMSITLRFEKGPVFMTRGLEAKLKSQVKGSLNSLLQVSLGKSAIQSFLQGEVTFSGNPLFLLRMLPLMRPVADQKEKIS